jgi:hypothetical protein
MMLKAIVPKLGLPMNSPLQFCLHDDGRKSRCQNGINLMLKMIPPNCDAHSTKYLLPLAIAKGYENYENLAFLFNSLCTKLL